LWVNISNRDWAQQQAERCLAMANTVFDFLNTKGQWFYWLLSLKLIVLCYVFMYCVLAKPWLWDFPEQWVHTAQETKKGRTLLIGRFPGFAFYLSGKDKRRIHSNWRGVKVKDKAMPMQAWAGPLESRRLSVLEFKYNRHMKVVRLSAVRTGQIYPQNKYSWYSFLLEVESTPGPYCSRNDYVN
jgi:hypothetical protein